MKHHTSEHFVHSYWLKQKTQLLRGILHTYIEKKMRKVECLVPSVSSITRFQTALTSNRLFMLYILFLGNNGIYSSLCFVASQYHFPRFLFPLLSLL